jgi:hypothetical protein
MMNSTIHNAPVKKFQSIAACILLLSLTIGAQENESDIFNRLYSEIISTAPNGNAPKMDSLIPKVEQSGFFDGKKDDHSSGQNILPDGSTDQLKEEIDRLVKEIQIRHSEKIRFMEDGKNR